MQVKLGVFQTPKWRAKCENKIKSTSSKIISHYGRGYIIVKEAS